MPKSIINTIAKIVEESYISGFQNGFYYGRKRISYKEADNMVGEAIKRTRSMIKSKK